MLILAISAMPSNEAGAQASPYVDIVSRVDGDKAYVAAMELENLTMGYPAYRSAASDGCSAAADWIEQRMTERGLTAHSESFSFPSWDLRSLATLDIAPDGDLDNANGLLRISSFNAEQWSHPSAPNGSDGVLIYLPLPDAASREDVGKRPIDHAVWNSVNTTGKVVLVGKEVRWSSAWEAAFMSKLTVQTPSSVIFTYSYSWMSSIDAVQIASVGGRPLGAMGPYMEDRGIPAGVVNYTQGQLLRANADGVAKARVCVDSFYDDSPMTHRNVVGVIQGTQQGRQVLITCHYDSVMTNGFCDNGAGVAGMLEIARVLREAQREGSFAPAQTIVFVAFGSEEIGFVGSLAYVSAHQAEMRSIEAVINLDCIGNRELRITPTDGSAGADVGQLLRGSAVELGVGLGDLPPGGSDQESFLRPGDIRNDVERWWGVRMDVDAGLRVANSVLLLSFPVFNTDIWTMNESGWIHTYKDTYRTSGWVMPHFLEEHMSIAALATMKLTGGEAPQAQGVGWMVPLLIVAAAAVAIAVATLLARRGR
jgi:hypothetical protein